MHDLHRPELNLCLDSQACVDYNLEYPFPMPWAMDYLVSLSLSYPLRSRQRTMLSNFISLEKAVFRTDNNCGNLIVLNMRAPCDKLVTTRHGYFNDTEPNRTTNKKSRRFFFFTRA